MITEANSSHQFMIQTLWNEQDWIYNEIDVEDTMKWIEREGNVFLVQMNQEKLEGFIFGNVNETSHKAYLSMIIVQSQKRNQGIGSSLLNQWIHTVMKKDSKLESIDIVFFDPNSFEWKISNNQNVFHPNTPGIHLGSGPISFFEKFHFIEYARQEVFFRSIVKYEMPKDIKTKIQSLEQDSIAIEFYDPKIHQGFDDYFRRNFAMHWSLAANQGLAAGQKVLVVTKNHQVIGFTGPLTVENTKRGYFAGIGIDHLYRGMGLGTVLFHSLCFHLSKLGASYMTLFTGTTNPARNIYLQAGFSLMDTFLNLRKNILVTRE